MRNVYYTQQAQRVPPYGAFADEVGLRVVDDSERFVMREYEFEWLANQLFDHWEQRRSPYIQILREWNECTGFMGSEGQASRITDVAQTIEALKLIKLPEPEAFGQLARQDLEQLIQFLMRNQAQPIEIYLK